MKRCLKCNSDATIFFSPDLDIKGFGSCENHKEEIEKDLIIAIFGKNRTWFFKKYKIK